MAPKAAGACNVDVMCKPGYEAQMRAVARMVFVVDGGGYTCTGSLLNNTLQDQTPYFLSANHCISTQTVASTLETYWNYRSASCGSSQQDSTYQIVRGGAQLLYASSNTDTSFLKLNGAVPGNAAFVGWDATTPSAVGTSVFGIHHPSGDWQKFSQGAVNQFFTCTAPYVDPVTGKTVFRCPSGSTTTPGNHTYYSVIFTEGTTEGGSSGSPLFTSNGRKVMGQLYGGTASCSDLTGFNVYGRFDLAYAAGGLAKWLSPPQKPSIGWLISVINFIMN
jgi:hypothetical protein